MKQPFSFKLPLLRWFLSMLVLAGGTSAFLRESIVRSRIKTSKESNEESNRAEVRPTFRVETGLSVSSGLAASRTPSYINQIIHKMGDAMKELDARNLKVEDLEKMAILIHESMSGVNRNYHSTQHIFNISEDLEDPIAVVSALFHDCIYFQVDGGLTKKQMEYLRGTYQQDSTTKSIQFFSTSERREDMQDRLLQMVEAIFGFRPGQEITSQNGLNEFLSAVIAVRHLESHLSFEELAQIACCIESTIPFRKTHPITGRKPLEELHYNFEQTRKKFDLKLTDEDLVKSVQRAAILSNNDVGNFGSTDRVNFLDNTWSLLDETNETLRGLYTLKEFQNAIFNVYTFFSSLMPSVVFHSYQGIPTNEEIDEKIRQCRINLQIGKKYVGAKLLALSLLAAFAELSGGDAPMSLFIGDLPSDQHKSISFADTLPNLPEGCADKFDKEVFTILSQGRSVETTFDTRQSPLAAYLYATMGDDEIESIITNNKMYPIERENSIKLLSSVPRSILHVVGDNIAKVAISRADKIEDLMRDITLQNTDETTPKKETR